MSKKSNRFSPEVREPAVRMVKYSAGQLNTLVNFESALLG
jgi:hypothetical protein